MTLRLRQIVLEADTSSGRVYNLIIFGTILFSFAGLLVQPHPLGIAAQSEQAAWLMQLEQGCLLVFVGDFLLHFWVSPKPTKYLFSF